MSIFSRTPALRWFVPVLAGLLLLGGGWAVSSISASARDGLEPRTAAELLVDVQNARLDGLSGTVVQTSDLGLPDLPGVGGTGSSDLGSLVAGTHTLRVWYSGPDKARLALLGTFGESDVIRNGDDLWIWSSDDKTATHHTLAGKPTDEGDQEPQLGELPRTPQDAAAAALAAIDPSTEVDTSGTAVVAGRSAYELVLEPRDSASLVDQVRIAIDGETKVPLRVQVLGEGMDDPAFEVAFTHFDPTRPDDAQFRFNPPPGTEVTESSTKPDPGDRGDDEPAPDRRPAQMPEVVGAGWTSVVITRLPAPDANASSDQPTLIEALPEVSGSWGSGRLLAGNLFSAVLTDDGRLAVGAVPPDRLYAALAAE